MRQYGTQHPRKGGKQLRRIDEDYGQWHQRRHQQFSNDFNDWRSRRQSSQRQATGGTATGSEIGDLGRWPEAWTAADKSASASMKGQK